MTDTCNDCGATYQSYAAYQRHNCNKPDDEPTKTGSLFGVEEARQRRKTQRRNDRWVRDH